MFPKGQKVPPAHETLLLAPPVGGEGEEPAPTIAHNELPALEATVPRGHDVGAEDPAGQKVPAKHWVPGAAIPPTEE